MIFEVYIIFPDTLSLLSDALDLFVCMRNDILCMVKVSIDEYLLESLLLQE